MIPHNMFFFFFFLTFQIREFYKTDKTQLNKVVTVLATGPLHSSSVLHCLDSMP